MFISHYVFTGLIQTNGVAVMEYQAQHVENLKSQMTEPQKPKSKIGCQMSTSLKLVNLTKGTLG